RAKILEDRATLVPGQSRIEWGGGRAELERAQERRGEGPAVGDRDRDAIARAHALAIQTSREPGRAPMERRVIERAVSTDDGRASGVNACDVLQGRHEIAGHGFPNRRRQGAPRDRSAPGFTAGAGTT